MGMAQRLSDVDDKVGFLVGGAQKSGTSALHKYLEMHPEIGVGDTKELGFFSNEQFYGTGESIYGRYEGRYKYDPNFKIYGESTPIYLYWKSSCKRIRNYNKNMKLIFILRNPSDRAFSQWNMEFDKSLDPEYNGFALETLPFDKAIKHESYRAKYALPYQHRVYSYIDRGYYSKQIERYQQYFPDDQLMFIKYEEFNTNQGKVLRDVFNFLGVDPNFSYPERVIENKRKKHASITPKDKRYLVDLFRDDIEKVESLLGWDCSDWLF